MGEASTPCQPSKQGVVNSFIAKAALRQDRRTRGKRRLLLHEMHVSAPRRGFGIFGYMHDANHKGLLGAICEELRAEDGNCAECHGRWMGDDGDERGVIRAYDVGA